MNKEQQIEKKQQPQKTQSKQKLIQKTRQCGWCPKMLQNNEGFCSKACENKWLREYL